MLKQAKERNASRNEMERSREFRAARWGRTGSREVVLAGLRRRRRRRDASMHEMARDVVSSVCAK